MMLTISGVPPEMAMSTLRKVIQSAGVEHVLLEEGQRGPRGDKTVTAGCADELAARHVMATLNGIVLGDFQLCVQPFNASDNREMDTLESQRQGRMYMDHDKDIIRDNRTPPWNRANTGSDLTLFSRRSNFENPVGGHFKQATIRTSERLTVGNFEGPNINNITLPTMGNFERPVMSIFERPIVGNFERPTMGFQQPSVNNIERLTLSKQPNVGNIKPLTVGNFERRNMSNVAVPHRENQGPQAPYLGNNSYQSAPSMVPPPLMNLVPVVNLNPPLSDGWSQLAQFDKQLRALQAMNQPAQNEMPLSASDRPRAKTPPWQRKSFNSSGEMAQRRGYRERSPIGRLGSTLPVSHSSSDLGRRGRDVDRRNRITDRRDGDIDHRGRDSDCRGRALGHRGRDSDRRGVGSDRRSGSDRRRVSDRHGPDSDRRDPALVRSNPNLDIRNSVPKIRDAVFEGPGPNGDGRGPNGLSQDRPGRRPDLARRPADRQPKRISSRSPSNKQKPKIARREPFEVRQGQGPPSNLPSVVPSNLLSGAPVIWDPPVSIPSQPPASHLQTGPSKDGASKVYNLVQKNPLADKSGKVLGMVHNTIARVTRDMFGCRSKTKGGIKPQYIRLMKILKETIRDRIVQILNSFTPASDLLMYKKYREIYPAVSDKNLLGDLAHRCNMHAPNAVDKILFESPYICPMMVDSDPDKQALFKRKKECADAAELITQAVLKIIPNASTPAQDVFVYDMYKMSAFNQLMVLLNSTEWDLIPAGELVILYHNKFGSDILDISKKMIEAAIDSWNAFNKDEQYSGMFKHVTNAPAPITSAASRPNLNKNVEIVTNAPAPVTNASLPNVNKKVEIVTNAPAPVTSAASRPNLNKKVEIIAHGKGKVLENNCITASSQLAIRTLEPDTPHYVIAQLAPQEQKLYRHIRKTIESRIINMMPSLPAQATVGQIRAMYRDLFPVSTDDILIQSTVDSYNKDSNVQYTGRWLHTAPGEPPKLQQIQIHAAALLAIKMLNPTATKVSSLSGEQSRLYPRLRDLIAARIQDIPITPAAAENKQNYAHLYRIRYPPGTDAELLERVRSETENSSYTKYHGKAVMGAVIAITVKAIDRTTTDSKRLHAEDRKLFAPLRLMIETRMKNLLKDVPPLTSRSLITEIMKIYRARYSEENDRDLVRMLIQEHNAKNPHDTYKGMWFKQENQGPSAQSKPDDLALRLSIRKEYAAFILTEQVFGATQARCLNAASKVDVCNLRGLVRRELRKTISGRLEQVDIGNCSTADIVHLYRSKYPVENDDQLMANVVKEAKLLYKNKRTRALAAIGAKVVTKMDQGAPHITKTKDTSEISTAAGVTDSRQTGNGGKTEATADPIDANGDTTETTANEVVEDELNAVNIDDIDIKMEDLEDY